MQCWRRGFVVLVCGHLRGPRPGAPTRTRPAANRPTGRRERAAFAGARQAPGPGDDPRPQGAMLEQPQAATTRLPRAALPWIGGSCPRHADPARRCSITGGDPSRREARRKIKPLQRLRALHPLDDRYRFIVLAISGLNYSFGKRLADAADRAGAFAPGRNTPNTPTTSCPGRSCSACSHAGRLDPRQHPRPHGRQLARQGGGFLGDGHPPARRFNAGQKVIFWSVILGVALAVPAS